MSEILTTVTADDLNLTELDSWRLNKELFAAGREEFLDAVCRNFPPNEQQKKLGMLSSPVFARELAKISDCPWLTEKLSKGVSENYSSIIAKSILPKIIDTVFEERVLYRNVGLLDYTHLYTVMSSEVPSSDVDFLLHISDSLKKDPHSFDYRIAQSYMLSRLEFPNLKHLKRSTFDDITKYLEFKKPPSAPVPVPESKDGIIERKIVAAREKAVLAAADFQEALARTFPPSEEQRQLGMLSAPVVIQDIIDHVDCKFIKDRIALYEKSYNYSDNIGLGSSVATGIKTYISNVAIEGVRLHSTKNKLFRNANYYTLFSSEYPMEKSIWASYLLEKERSKTINLSYSLAIDYFLSQESPMQIKPGFKQAKGPIYQTMEDFSWEAKTKIIEKRLTENPEDAADVTQAVENPMISILVREKLELQKKLTEALEDAESLRESMQKKLTAALTEVEDLRRDLQEMRDRHINGQTSRLEYIVNRKDKALQEIVAAVENSYAPGSISKFMSVFADRLTGVDPSLYISAEVASEIFGVRKSKIAQLVFDISTSTHQNDFYILVDTDKKTKSGNVITEVLLTPKALDIIDRMYSKGKNGPKKKLQPTPTINVTHVVGEQVRDMQDDVDEVVSCGSPEAMV